MKRKPAKASYAFHRFMQQIFVTFHDRGMPLNTAKLRMYKEVYDTCLDFSKKEKDIPDHVLVITMQHASRHLNQRGALLAKKLKDEKDQQQIQILRQALQDIKKAKDAVDQFITSYRGENHGGDSQQ